MSVTAPGTGVMGSAIARRAARAGMPVHARSRPLGDAQHLAAEGITVNIAAAFNAAIAHAHANSGGPR